ncbi:hypothetical protein TYRP_003356 [Tyrophagus putrescentiae]|nr:hypothetical protein TYRP_003356 [Tyrophagus putrescentiae]
MNGSPFTGHHRLLATITSLLLLTLLVGSTLTMNSDDYEALPDDLSDHDIAYRCFYDHSWLVHRRHHCHSIASSGRHWVHHRSTARHRRLRVLLQSILVKDRADRRLVKHCFAYHQFDSSRSGYLPCRTIISWQQSRQHQSSSSSSSSPTTDSLRQARLRQLWAKEVADKRREINRTRFFEGHDAALVLHCLYTTDWLTDGKHRCHEVAYGGGDKAEFSRHDLKLQEMYREERQRATLEDCLHYHQDDRLNRCYGITWHVERR